MAKAAEDLALAAQILEAFPGPASFHTQQAVEKLLKGMIVRAGKRPPYIHALLPLRDIVGAELEWDPGGPWLDAVSPWSADSRYPWSVDAWTEEKVGEVREAIEQANILLIEVKSKLA